MAQVRAGVAYVDVRLGQIEDFKRKLASEVESAMSETTKKVGEKMAKEMAPQGAKVGKATADSMSKSFFSDAGNSFNAGMRALMTGQAGVARQLMRDAGSSAAAGFREGFRPALASVGSSFRSSMAGLRTAAVSAANSASAALSTLPEKIRNAGVAADALSQKVGFLGFQMINFGFIASTAFTAPVAAALGFGAVIGIKTAAQIEQATAGLKALTPAGTDVEAVLKRLQDLAKKSPIFNTSDIIAFTQKMVAAGLSVQDTEAFLASFGNIALTVGADIGKVPFALEALVQMMAKGKVSMEELRQQLGEALPGAMKISADAMGVTQEQFMAMVSEGEISGEQLIKALTKIGQSEKFLRGAGLGAETLGAKWQELKESVQIQLGQVFLDNSADIKKALDELGPVMSDLIKEAGPLFVDMVKGFASLVKGVAKLINWYQNLSPTQQDIVNKLMLFTVIIGPLVLILGLFATAIGGIAALFSAIATPVGIVIVGIIALAIEITVLISYLKNLYSEGGRFKEIWDRIWKAAVELVKPIGEELGKLWEQIKEGITQITDAFKQNADGWGVILYTIKGVLMVIGTIIAVQIGIAWGVIKGVISAIGPLFKAISSVISGVVKIIGGVLEFLVGVFTLDFKKMGDGLRSIWDGLWDLIVGTLVNVIKAIINFVKGFVTGIIDFFKFLYNILVGNSIVPDMVNAILAWFKRMVDRGAAFVKALGKPFLDFYNNFIKPFIERVKDGADRAVGLIRDLGGKIRDAFSSAGSWLYNAGKNIVNGLINGVRSMGNTLKNAILALIPGPVRGIVESALGISSPSKVFAEYGKFTVQGFISGMESYSDALQYTTASVFDLAPAMVNPLFGDVRDPVIDSSSGRGPAVLIENYNEAQNDPDRIAEDLWFKINSRGGGY